jgi:hypothetical protein
MSKGKTLWDLWVQNWENASKFFNSKGNTNTRSKLKTKWHKGFMAMFENLEAENEQLKKSKEKMISGIDSLNIRIRLLECDKEAHEQRWKKLKKNMYKNQHIDMTGMNIIELMEELEQEAKP